MGTQRKRELGKVIKHRKGYEYGISRKQFHDLLKKASQPVSHEVQSDSSKSQTSESRPSGDCSETGRSPNNLEGKQG
jgi:hypothetical protein